MFHLTSYFQLSAILREVHYLKLMGFSGIPEAALKLLERSEIFRKYTSVLNTTINWYNKIKRSSRDVEFELIQTELEEIDKLAEAGQNTLTWNSENLWDFVTKLHMLVGNLQQHLQKSQDNINEIKNILKPFARKPLFERKDGRKDTVLCVDERHEKATKRYSEMRKIAKQIENFLQQNMQLFEMEDKQNDAKWVQYIEFVDGIVLNYLFQTVGCRYIIL